MTGPADAGLQAERTRLAWSRTCFSVAVVGALVLHGAHNPVGFACGVLILCCAVLFGACGLVRYRRMTHALAEGHTTARHGMTRWIAVLAVTPGLAAATALLVR